MGAHRPIAASARPRRRDEALAFIIERIARFGTSPTLDEIGVALRVSKPRARELVDQLIAIGLIEKTMGTQRNLRVRDVTEARGLLHQALRNMGWIEAEPLGDLQQPFTQDKLPVWPGFEHLPDID